MKWNEIDPIQSDIVYFQLLIRDGPWQCKRVPDKLEKEKEKKNARNFECIALSFFKRKKKKISALDLSFPGNSIYFLLTIVNYNLYIP